MLKHFGLASNLMRGAQPPSGGCVLKLILFSLHQAVFPQPPSGGCVLKQTIQPKQAFLTDQPPSGGCVLKLCLLSAAFRV